MKNSPKRKEAVATVGKWNHPGIKIKLRAMSAVFDYDSKKQTIMYLLRIICTATDIIGINTKLIDSKVERQYISVLQLQHLRRHLKESERFFTLSHRMTR